MGVSARLAALLLGSALLFSAACGGGDGKSPAATATAKSDGTGTPVGQVTSQPGETATIASSTSPVPDPAAQPVRNGNFELTVNGVTDPYTPADEAYEAAEGDRLLLIDVSLTNVSQEELDYGADYFVVLDADGFDYGPSFADQAQEFDVGALGAGDTVRGQIAFEVPAETRLTSLLFDPDLDPATSIQIALP